MSVYEYTYQFDRYVFCQITKNMDYSLKFNGKNEHIVKIGWVHLYGISDGDSHVLMSCDKSQGLLIRF